MESLTKENWQAELATYKLSVLAEYADHECIEYVQDKDFALGRLRRLNVAHKHWKPEMVYFAARFAVYGPTYMREWFRDALSSFFSTYRGSSCPKFCSIL